MESNFQIPKEIPGSLKYLAKLYEKRGDDLLKQILRSCSFWIEKEYSYDNWNGGTYGHRLYLFLPENILLNIDSNNSREELEKTLNEALNNYFKSVDNEFIDGVCFRLASSSVSNFDNAIKLIDNKIHLTDGVEYPWKKGFFKLFVSHKDSYKKEVSDLSTLLDGYGISCFVAHEDIEPLKEWENEIEKALFTMDALLIFLTDDFKSSNWADQEVGVAIGRSIPILPLKVQNTDPYGLVSKYQAIKGNLKYLDKLAQLIFESLLKQPTQAPQVLVDFAIERFSNSSSYADSA